MTNSSREDTTALEELADALDPGRYATIMVGGQGTPTLRVVSRSAPQLAKDIYAGASHFCFSPSEPIAPVNDAAAAAGQIAYLLSGGLRANSR